MARNKRRLTYLAIALLATAALLIGASVLANSGDYGVNTGASTQSTCGGSGPSCTISYNGHSASFQVTNNDGSHSYQFDDYDCVAVVSPSGSITIGGNECSSVSATATPAPTDTPDA